MGVYRIWQESLNNIVRHSEATEATLCLHWEGEIVDIVISDNGRGFTPSENPVPQPGLGGFGLLGIAERVRMLGGHLAVVSSPGAGTVINISLQSHRRQT